MPTTAPRVSLARAYRAQIDDVSRPKRTVTARINTGRPDRYDTVIMPGGLDLRAFQRNPCVLWEHGNDPTRGKVPVARCRSIKWRRAEDDLLAVSEFVPDDYGQRIFDLYADGTLNGFSVEFLPDLGQASRPTSKELRDRPDWGKAHTIYRRCELTGYSAVAIPGNAEALAVAVTRGLWVPANTRSWLAKRTLWGRQGTTAPARYYPRELANLFALAAIPALLKLQTACIVAALKKMG
jgi:hypothetical protein